MRFGKEGKLSPRHIGPYQIIRRVGRVAYKLDLPSDHNPSRVAPFDDVHITEKLTYEEVPIAILDRQVRRLRTKDIPSVKVLWRSNNVEEVTREAEKEMRSRYPHLFNTPDFFEHSDGKIDHLISDGYVVKED
ncbi:PREDICTED: uncharacterized protein LOC109234781 [Nicotiana attenuata]|uniref:uncharacterized protein LOC109234781 n=1 Tax=Nicotiana attenuata TaxID=49451 RepID=UPI000905D8EB|nr:PREDICTED: uncharacterized protein LOC109234781 [Nicotiana attenuata]